MGGPQTCVASATNSTKVRAPKPLPCRCQLCVCLQAQGGPKREPPGAPRCQEGPKVGYKPPKRPSNGAKYLRAPVAHRAQHEKQRSRVLRRCNVTEQGWKGRNARTHTARSPHGRSDSRPRRCRSPHSRIPAPGLRDTPHGSLLKTPSPGRTWSDSARCTHASWHFSQAKNTILFALRSRGVSLYCGTLRL